MPPLTTILITLFLQLTASAAASKPPDYGGATYPIHKDSIQTQLYQTTLQIGTPPKSVNFTLTLSNQILWYICIRDGFDSTTYRPVPCESNMCSVAEKHMIPCHTCETPIPRPGCTNDTCRVMTYNPYDSIYNPEPFYTDVLQVPSHAASVHNFSFLCAGDIMYYLKGLPKGNKGMLGLALSTFSLPIAVSSGLNLPRTFALCLPSDGTITGKLLIGGGPYRLLGNLMHTPIIINPYSTKPFHGSREESYEYFVDVTSIKVGTVPLKLNKTLLSFYDAGYGGTKLSLDTPYTILQKAIYSPLVDQFTKESEGLGLKRVKSVGKFSACFSGNGVAWPTIDFVLDKAEVHWRMQGFDLMLKVSESVSCLGVVDGGEKPRTAVVIGGKQMEERVVEFDLKSMQIGFSESLRQFNTTCSS